MKHTIICDIDGTVADLSHRLRHIRPPGGGKKNWDKFHSECWDDAPHMDMLTILTALVNYTSVKPRTVVYVSGRMEKSRWDTREWLNRHTFPMGELYMRANDDFRPDDIVKEEILDRYLKLTPNDVLCVLDDRNRVVDMWRRRGFRCLQVAPGDF